TAATQISAAALHDALPISSGGGRGGADFGRGPRDRSHGTSQGHASPPTAARRVLASRRMPQPPSWLDGSTLAPAQRAVAPRRTRSEEHTSELQSRVDLVCR